MQSRQLGGLWKSCDLVFVLSCLVIRVACLNIYCVKFGLIFILVKAERTDFTYINKVAVH